MAYQNICHARTGLELRPLIRISKTLSRQILGRMLDYHQKYIYEYKQDTVSCSSCSCRLHMFFNEIYDQLKVEKEKPVPDVSVIMKLNDELNELKALCASRNCSYMETKKIYLNDKSRYGLYDKKYVGHRLPKSAIRVYLFLFSLPQETLGSMHFIRDIALADIADELSITVSTVQSALEILSNFHYITYSHASSLKHYNISITDYDAMHLSAKEGGRGYFTVSSDMMKEILSIDNVNSLRLEILTLLKLDDSIVSGKDGSEYSIHDLKNIMPRHMNYGENFKKLRSNQPSVMDTVVADGKLSFMLKAGRKLRYDMNAFKFNRTHILRQRMDNLDVTLTEEQWMDVANLTIEYTDDTLIRSISYINHNYILPNKQIISFGALLRRCCQRSYSLAA